MGGRLFAAAVLAACLATAAGAAEDRHAGYYYPEPQTSERYEGRAQPMPDTNRARRIGFVTALTTQMMSNPYPPPFHVFAKGEEAEKMIIVASGPGLYDTLYRMRGLLAALTANARTTPLFRENEVDDYFTFFDLAILLGFQLITVSDGERFSHQVMLGPEKVR